MGPIYHKVMYPILNKKQIEIDYKKVLRVIKSCQCEEHLDATNRLITYFYYKHENGFLLEKLEKRFWFKKKLILKK